MLHYWKSGKQKIAYDTASGAVIALTSLEYKMIQAITPPLAPLCPSSLRYELAKFDSADVEEAYEKIYRLYTQGILFATPIAEQPRVCIGEAYGLTEANDLAREVLNRLGDVHPEWIVAPDIDAAVADRIKALL